MGDVPDALRHLEQLQAQYRQAQDQADRARLERNHFISELVQARAFSIMVIGRAAQMTKTRVRQIAQALNDGA